LGRFVCPADLLPKLSSFVEELFPTSSPLSLSIIIKCDESLDGFLDTVLLGAYSLIEFHKGSRGKVTMDAIEWKIPGDAVRCLSEVENLLPSLDNLDMQLAHAGIHPTHVWYELPQRDAWGQKLSVLLATLRIDSRRKWGFKLRCGGSGSSTMPGTDD